MIVYNVTINVDEDIHGEWLAWMKKVHIPQVMATGMFHEYRMMKMLTRSDGETGVTYAIQYISDSMEKYRRYQDEFAPALQAETRRLYEGKFVAFRSLLETV